MEHQSPAVAPLTPSRRAEQQEIPRAPKVTRVEIKMILDDLTRTWDLRLEMPPENELPSKRLGRPQTPEQRCVALITALSYKNYHVEPITTFKKTAKFLWSGWKLKPNGDRDVIPTATRDTEHPLTNSERELMIELLLEHLEGPGAELKEKNKTPRHLRPTSESDGTPIFKDDPIKFPLSTPDKRARDEQVRDAQKSTKKSKYPETIPTPLSENDSNAMLPPDRGLQSFKDTGGYRSANTSFGSSTNSSVFSVNHSFGYPVLPNTQQTVPDLAEQSFQKVEDLSIAASRQSSDYGARSSFDEVLNNTFDANAVLLDTTVNTACVEGGLSSQLGDIELQPNIKVLSDIDILQDRLEYVFPKLPPSLEKAPLHIVYEITRVFTHAGVSMSDINFLNISTFGDYKTLWDFLLHLPILEGKPFPDKSDPLAWEAANGDYTYKGSGVMLGGSLKFNYSSETGPFFQFRLKPLSLDRRCRLGRKLGEDRFLVLDMPHLNGKDVPKVLQGEDCQDLLLDWLEGGPHWLFGRSWKPFSTKTKEEKTKQEKKKAKKERMDKKKEVSHSVTFFAVSGHGLGQQFQSPGGQHRPNIEIPKLLNYYVRLTRKNKHHPFLKLFSRTTLALSRNTPTLIFELSQIKYKPDIKVNGKEMTDGAGLISPAAAAQVRDHLGLSFLPSGFQGRIGQAKGFWIVDHSDLSDEIWIECYDSQCKWVRTKRRDPEYCDNDVNNRTFEVVNTSGPLKSADLNLQFLNILVERAKDKEQMRLALRNLLEVGLQSELDNLLTSVEDAQTLRKWVQDKAPNDQLRVKHGQVHYEAGLPKLPSEILVMLLDAGFETKQLNYAMELCKKLFRSKCDELKDRLNITVGKSTYAYMVPDFWGVLEENEVYINCPTFTEDVHGTTGDSLFGREVLVTRTPAHFASDVQKVRAVAKTELMGLRDVIIFSTKGYPLADKLSGGDYDGDIAWVCWEPSLVNNFVNAAVPNPMPNLVEEGYITQDKTTYGELADDLENPDSEIMKRALRFNMQQNMLGICTAWKNQLCYNLGDLSAPEAIKTCALLSNLVDMPKQGYSLTEENWTRFKDDQITSIKKRNPRFMLRKEEYKEDQPRCHERSKHIVDYLTWVAKTKVDQLYTEFEQTLSPNIPHWDEDLVAYARWAEKERKEEIKTQKEAEKLAKERGENTTEEIYGWKDILLDLTNDLDALKKSWADAWGKRDSVKNKDELESFSTLILRFHDLYTNILPHQQNFATRLLLADHRHPELSEWEMLKASWFFFEHRNHKNSIKEFVWQMAGRQFCCLKAGRNERGVMHVVVPGMYVVLRPNNGMIRQLQTRNLAFVEECGMGESGEEGEEWDIHWGEGELWVEAGLEMDLGMGYEFSRVWF